MASVRGILIFRVVPCPCLLWTSTVPPVFSMLVRTTSIPTPRPETLVTFSAVEKPGMKMRRRISRSPMWVARSAVMMPRSMALRRTLSGSIPAPSSVISMLTCPPSWNARKCRRPVAGLPAATRASAVSMPWSIELRTMWTSGSLIASMTVRSSSVSLPSSSRSTCLPHVSDRSRTTRGSLFHTLAMGCMRVRMTPSCSSVVMRLRRWEVPTKAASLRCAPNWRIWLRARTSSPTRFISLSSSPTSTRMLVSATGVCASVCASSASTMACGVTLLRETRISPSFR